MELRHELWSYLRRLHPDEGLTILLTTHYIEEAEADLERLRTWLKRIQTRDYFGADGRADAEAALERCAEELAAFEVEALTAELAPEQSEEAKPRRLRAVDD